MLRIEVRFPLGVYHALSNARFGAPEWPPSPVRLVGALLAAAHEAPGVDTDAARSVLERVCAADPPVIVAPDVVALDGQTDVAGSSGTAVVALRGASRWAPRNHSDSEIARSGLSPRNLARERTEVHKGGVAIGDRPIELRWDALRLDDAERRILGALLDELTFLGTSRSPAVAWILDDVPAEGPEEQWEPASGVGRGDADVRIPDARLIRAFDLRHDARRATGKKPVAASEHVPNVALGTVAPYVLRSRRLAAETQAIADPREWGEMLVLELDPGPPPGASPVDHSELRPKGAAGYLVARAFRAALLGAYDAPGTPGEAPPILRGRGDEAHVAIVPLPFVGTITKRSGSGDDRREHRIPADGVIRGIAVLLPHEDHVPDVAQQAERVKQGLMRFVAGDRRWVDIPGAGRIFLRLPSPDRPQLQTLRDARYRRASRVWETVLPVVHAHRRTSKGPRGLLRQVEADCAHVGLPAPVAVEPLEYSARGGAPQRLVPDRLVPADWRGPLDGPRSHLRITFEQPVLGPVVLGRARHFGVGLCLPNMLEDARAADASRRSANPATAADGGPSSPAAAASSVDPSQHAA